MTGLTECGYTGKILRVDLTKGLPTEERIQEETARKYIGGTGLGSLYLYKEVPPNVKWSDPENRFMARSGPLGGTIGGTGEFPRVLQAIERDPGYFEKLITHRFHYLEYKKAFEMAMDKEKSLKVQIYFE